MRRQQFKITVTYTKTPVDIRQLGRLLAASAVRQHLAEARQGGATAGQGAEPSGKPLLATGPQVPVHP